MNKFLKNFGVAELINVFSFLAAVLLNSDGFETLGDFLMGPGGKSASESFSFMDMIQWELLYMPLLVYMLYLFEEKIENYGLVVLRYGTWTKWWLSEIIHDLMISASTFITLSVFVSLADYRAFVLPDTEIILLMMHFIVVYCFNVILSIISGSTIFAFIVFILIESTGKILVVLDLIGPKMNVAVWSMSYYLDRYYSNGFSMPGSVLLGIVSIFILSLFPYAKKCSEWKLGQERM